ncbi:unnamed protein product [Scytosiphon promiscuus]
MVRRQRDEIGKTGAPELHRAAAAAKGAGTAPPIATPGMTSSAEAAAVEPSATPPPPPNRPSRKVCIGDANDDEDAVRAFDAALSLCAEEGSEVPVDAVRALFAAAVQRVAEARRRRDSMEDRCNEVAAKNQAAASELANRRATACRAKTSKLSMEVKCREQAQLNQLTAEHGKIAKAQEEARSAELREKFETAVPGIQEKLKLEAERRQQQRKDNEDLQGKLVSFAEQTRHSKEACAAQLTPASLRVEIAKAKSEQQEAERRAANARVSSLEVELERAKASHAKLKADTTQRERSLSKIQNILNERKSMSAALEVKTKELLVSKGALEAECVILRKLAASEEVRRSHPGTESVLPVRVEEKRCDPVRWSFWMSLVSTHDAQRDTYSFFVFVW